MLERDSRKTIFPGFRGRKESSSPYVLVDSEETGGNIGGFGQPNMVKSQRWHSSGWLAPRQGF